MLTGGSEASGYTHRTTIAENLEKILNEKSQYRFKVLNLAMNSYCLANEVNSYVHLVYQLKPEFVISHSGWNDMVYGSMVPYNFKKLGLNYLRYIEFWLPRLYFLRDYRGRQGTIFNEKGYEIIADTYLKNLQKYKDIVNTNGGILIVGLQGYNREACKGYPIYEKIQPLYKELIEKSSKMGYAVDFTKYGDIKYIDSIHSTEESSLKIAQVYAGLVLSELNKKIGKDKSIEEYKNAFYP